MARTVTTIDGYVLAVLQNGMGAWCGYIGLPDAHPWHGLGYDRLHVDVHGGLTYSESDPPGCALLQLSLASGAGPPPSWWLGFDCAHAGDFIPGLGYGLLRGERVWTQEDTWAEAENMLAQARAATS